MSGRDSALCPRAPGGEAAAVTPRGPPGTERRGVALRSSLPSEPAAAASLGAPWRPQLETTVGFPNAANLPIKRVPANDDEGRGAPCQALPATTAPSAYPGRGLGDVVTHKLASAALCLAALLAAAIVHSGRLGRPNPLRGAWRRGGRVPVKLPGAKVAAPVTLPANVAGWPGTA